MGDAAWLALLDQHGLALHRKPQSFGQTIERPNGS